MLPELPGILNWAIEGLKRLRSRGHFLQPASSQDAITEMEDLASPVGAFVRDYCDVAPGKTIPSTELFEAWKSWCKSQGREHAGTIQIFGRDLRAAVAGLKIGRPREDGGRIRTYEGIDLSAAVRREMVNEMAGRMEAQHANA
jgi:putative DNA primase/helicase